jgi:hypothetical protein
MDTPDFDAVRDRFPNKAVAWDLGNRPAVQRPCDASALDPGTVIVAGCEPKDFRALIQEWGDPRAAEEIAEEMYQRELERAAQPPVIEVTVTTPPEGIPRLELTQLVAETVAEVTGPLAALPLRVAAEGEGKPRRRKVLFAARRARNRRGTQPAQPVPGPPPPFLPSPSALPPPGWVLPASEDDTPTAVIPAVPPDDGFELVEVHVP